MDGLIIIIVFAIIIFIRFLLEDGSTREEQIGRAGENWVSWQLRAFPTLQDMLLPSASRSREWTQIDHIVRLNSCIIVIEVKNVSGSIYGGQQPTPKGADLVARPGPS